MVPCPVDDHPTLGPYKFSDLSVYMGQWKNGFKHGYGVQMWVDGSIYEGHWVSDVCSGFGRLIHSDGDTYQGEWSNDKANGHVRVSYVSVNAGDVHPLGRRQVYRYVEGRQAGRRWNRNLAGPFRLQGAVQVGQEARAGAVPVG